MNQLFESYKVFLKYRRWTTGFIATSLLLKNGLQHVFPLNLYMPFHATLSCSDYPMDHQYKLLGAVKRDLNFENCNTIPFVSNNPHVISAGFSLFLKLKQTNVIGIPKTFYCHNIIEAEELNIRLGQTKALVTGRTENQVKFLESLVLSRSAQKFATARHLMYIKDNWSIFQALLPSIFVFIWYLACFHGPRLLYLHSKQVPLVHLIRWSIVSVILGYFLCKFAKSSLNYWMLDSIDNKVAKVSKDYAEGGEEFYEKLLSGNEAQFVLLGKHGQKYLTAFGNEKDGIIFNSKGAPLTERLKNVKNILSTYKQSD